MSNVTITLSGEGMHETSSVNIQVSVVAAVKISAKRAQRQVTAWLASEVGNMLMAGEPQLLISEGTVWQVPAILTSSVSGHLGQVGLVNVDTENGQLLVDDETKARILRNVEEIIRPA